MGKKNKKKSSAAKKKSKKAGAESDEFLAEAKEEMVALEAIFDEEFEAHEDGGGFNLTIVPHPGEAESNFVSVQLVVRQAATCHHLLQIVPRLRWTVFSQLRCCQIPP